MRFGLRPYIIAGAAIAGASVIVLAPASPPLPNIEVPAVQPAGSELSGFNQQDLLGALANIDGMFPAPETEGFNPPDNPPGPGTLPSPAIAPPELGPMDLGGLDLNGLNPSTVPSPPGNSPAIP
ncbi:MAG: hypothetical protein J2P16_04420 [Mycobacterium sp.]|nr:hypothetical protein [Mycobacterium sp.]